MLRFSATCGLAGSPATAARQLSDPPTSCESAFLRAASELYQMVMCKCNTAPIFLCPCRSCVPATQPSSQGYLCSVGSSR